MSLYLRCPEPGTPEDHAACAALCEKGMAEAGPEIEHYYMFALLRIKCLVNLADAESAITAYAELIDTTIENDADPELAGDVLEMGTQIAPLDPTAAARLEPLVRKWAGHYGGLSQEALAERWGQGKVEAIRTLAAASRRRFREEP
jgi:hypothetical protein